MTAQLLTIGEGLVELGLRDGEPTVELGFGGDAANVAVMAAREGAAAGLVGRVGRDALGRRAVAFWSAAGVDVTTLAGDDGGPTGIYVNELGSDGVHRFDYHRLGSAGSRLRRDDLPARALAACRILHVTGITLAVSASSAEAVGEAIAVARRAGALISLGVNHRPQLGGDVDALRRIARDADLVFLSDAEALELAGADDPAEVAARLAPAAREVVLRRGADGATVLAGGAVAAHRTPAPLEATDAAGAGDALAGAYLAARLADLDIPQALARAVTAATLSCRRRGFAASYPSRAEVDAALAAEVA